MAPDGSVAARSRLDAPKLPTEVDRLFHSLNNQLGVILANAELLEHRLVEDAQRARATQIVTGALDAISTARHLRQCLREPVGGPTP